MKFKPLILILLILGLTKISAQGLDGSVAVKLYGYPVLPSMSEIRLELYANTLASSTSFDPLSLQLWYLAATPYFLPDAFFESGASIHWNFGDIRRPFLSLGVGTAFSLERDTVSIPLILSAEGKYRVLGLWIINPLLRGLIYGEGYILETQLNNTVPIIKDRVQADLGAQFIYSYSDTAKAFAVSMGMSLGIRFLF